jgi:excisionase family DNA binding protein
MKLTNLLTTAQAAEMLGVNPSRVRQLVLAGRLPAERVGRDLFLPRAAVLNHRPLRAGRPKKSSRKNRKQIDNP